MIMRKGSPPYKALGTFECSVTHTLTSSRDVFTFVLRNLRYFIKKQFWVNIENLYTIGLCACIKLIRNETQGIIASEIP
jgi:hypothetical protein